MDETQNGGIAPVQPAAPVTAQPEPVAPVTSVTSAPAEPLPADTRDRTREQFEKLLESNRRLMEQNEVLRQQHEQRRQNQVFDPIQNAPQFQPVNPDDFVERDPISGERVINEQRLKARIEELQQKASRAETAIQSYIKTADEREVTRQERETFSAYPELDPKNQKFDTNFNKQVRGILTDSFYAADEYGGKPLSFKEAADFVKAQFPKPAASQPSSEEQAAAQAAADAAQTAKEQGSARAQSQPRPQVQQDSAAAEELESLRYRTRYLNDDEALARRIMHTEHILPENAEEVS